MHHVGSDFWLQNKFTHSAIMTVAVVHEYDNKMGFAVQRLIIIATSDMCVLASSF